MTICVVLELASSTTIGNMNGEDGSVIFSNCFIYKTFILYKNTKNKKAIF